MRAEIPGSPGPSGNFAGRHTSGRSRGTGPVGRSDRVDPRRDGRLRNQSKIRPLLLQTALPTVIHRQILAY